MIDLIVLFLSILAETTLATPPPPPPPAIVRPAGPVVDQMEEYQAK